MKKALLTLTLGAFAAFNASAAIIDIGGASVVSSTSNSVQFAQPGGAAGAPTFSTFNCGPTLCTAASLVASGVANALDGSGDAFTITYGANGTLTYTLTAAPVVTSSVSGVVAALVGNITGTDSVFANLTGVKTGAVGQLSFQNNGGGNGTTFSLTVSQVPEPGSMALLGSGLVGLGFIARRRRASK